MQRVNIKAVEAFIKKNPAATYAEFAKNTKGVVPISDCYYYTLRRKLTGAIGDSRKKSNTYIRLFLTDAKEVSVEAKTLLQKFIDSMNTTLNTKMEIIEFGDPSQLEIRELKF